ncbi:MAG: 4Fe-4S dicluster domain-containing protein [Actinobacteria bacterium]|nr:4Fe-4S dicluster domain-containing protein [Actinomycetota bacterium]
MAYHSKDRYIIKAEDFIERLKGLSREMRVYAPVKRRGQIIFDALEKDDEIQIDYGMTMLSPTRFLFSPREMIFDAKNRVEESSDSYLITADDISPGFLATSQMIVGVHPHDMHAVLVLDRVFLSGDFVDEAYRYRRENTAIVVINQTQVWDTCFSYSMGTGPFFNSAEGCDLILTWLGQELLAEPMSKRGKEIVSAFRLRKATSRDMEAKGREESRIISLFKKEVVTDKLPELILNNQDHAIWRMIAEDRCLGCTNCTMVCPTCFCYNIEDENSIDLSRTQRSRYWASCQELNFAKVHGSNFRASRAARLRQFVTHKLATWIEQFGCFGCIGCGRCMYWCPTNIDLVDIAKALARGVSI